MASLPREKLWDSVVPGTCVDLANVLISGAVINVMSDFSMLILPIAKVWQLQITTGRKWGIPAVFGTGLFACISSIMRLVNNIEFSATDDDTFQLTPVALWTLAEISSGIVVGRLPVLPAFFRHFVPRIVATLNSYSHRRRVSKNSRLNSKGTNQWNSQATYLELNDNKRTIGVPSQHAGSVVSHVVGTEGYNVDREGRQWDS
ncbi:hypothetical protein MMC27_007535 [Xylographa pallens]|nr:hypothetical protein [Xylographa pallens]